MSNALDMPLDDIIKASKSSRRSNAPRGAQGGRGGRASGPTRNLRQGRDNKPYQAGVQQYRASPAAPLHTSVIRQSVPDGSKMQVSNLDNRVTAEDLKLVFSTRVGPLKKCTLVYDQHGKSTGTAVIHFSRVGDAAIAYSKFNGVPLDGRPMKIEIVLAPATARAVLPAAQTPRAPASNQGQQRPQSQGQQRPQSQGRGGRGGRGRGRGGRGQSERKETKTADQLDAEMSDYMQVDA
ncbi:hypothetical protein BC939DRAFT_520052 [Gamsiella multidivaricata]|uniref:uncharacterized protein n=1 Tax=Gamsiella multidivaricata TaxID=101098 RepID=UPI00222129AD|nr:uncharacterized protein BC939DRAFT_520052 [Gamsiella multidivaricata]KAG0368626.1 hypothetical protein BGZ54_001543 [Gamsiella multidivaricata]KAI7819901.1 hypothetical protein BC939DRAFT_520052 [Gamsiella multidivaricata]